MRFDFDVQKRMHKTKQIVPSMTNQTTRIQCTFFIKQFEDLNPNFVGQKIVVHCQNLSQKFAEKRIGL